MIFCILLGVHANKPSLELIMEIQYWDFAQAHPAHINLSPDIETRAVDLLTCSYGGEHARVCE